MAKHTNSLINETSPYLLQHAHNPVNWYPWGDEALERARTENKLILISIGYSACHWCHVMERESFEVEAVAAVMNEHFINIKVDREERPDVDQVYMSAVQLMTGRGGWPLNCFALPDGRPIYGGTYFPQEEWMHILPQLHDLYTTDPTRAVEYAVQLTRGVALTGLVEKDTSNVLPDEHLLMDTIEEWKNHMDDVEGGPAKAPKFPLPNNYQFLLRYGVLFNDAEIMQHVNLSLKKMAYGGIYDQVGGGFARYSVDGLWKVPHFEKMLYDNAQLVSLYAEAFKATGNVLYKNVVDETLAFISRELTSAEGLFYSALDADSEGVEGKFYVWNKEELQALLGDDYALAAAYYNINSQGLWEHGNYILLRIKDDEAVASAFNLTVDELREKVKLINNLLLVERAKRIRPGLDDKCLASWNALMIRGYADAYRYLGNEDYKHMALHAMHVFEEKFLQPSGALFHNYKNGRSTITGFLEDYCFAIDTCLALYEITFDAAWIAKAQRWVNVCYAEFFDDESGMFFFTATNGDALIARKMEVFDNVIPSSNSSLARSLYTLALLTGNTEYRTTALQMLRNTAGSMAGYGSGCSNWAMLALQLTKPFYEVVIIGENALEKYAELNQNYLPQTLIAAAVTGEELDVFHHRQQVGKTLIYVCQNNSCHAPVESVDEVLKEIN